MFLRSLGLDVHVFSLLQPLATPVHRQAEEMLPHVHYSPFLFSRGLFKAHFHYLIRSPLKYVRALRKAVWQTWSEPGVLLRALLLFPKAVYFARQAEHLSIGHIHAHFVWVNGLAAQIASDLTGIPFSLHPHAFDLFSRNQEAVRRQLALADGVITIADYHRQYIARLCPDRAEEIRVVYNGLDPAEFTPGHFPAEDGLVRLLSVGSLIEKKGHRYLIEACALLAKRGYAFRCAIVGVGPLQVALQAQIDDLGLTDRVFLIGAKTQAEVKDLYRGSDIFALPCVVAAGGDRDGVPTVLVEAMAMELPVVTTPVTGIPEFVVDGETGLLGPERDAAALAAAIERLIDDPALARRLGRQGRRVVLDKFDVHQTGPQLVAAFKDIRKR